MQIDFHHTATYVIARAAGFDHPKAEIIAYAAQYIDDATSSGTVYFDNQAVYNRISSAHEMLDARNSRQLANHQVWLAFHFLPGNGDKKAGNNPDGSFINKIICRPNSPIAQEMVRDTIVQQDRPYGLHRLGVAMHVYADTWAHQGFAGVLHKVNEVEDAKDTGSSGVFDNPMGKWWRDMLDDAIPPLGHGRANVFPDMPFLQWKYKNGKGQKIKRDNTADFLEAAEHMCMAMQRYIVGNPDADVDGLDEDTRDKLRKLFVKLKKKDADKRHAKWMKKIRNGFFHFEDCDKLADYRPRGDKSWKAQALGISDDLPVHRYKPEFLTSNWKLFHDAIQAHRFHVIHDTLPKYGICAA
uniref:Uncharacterized protein n=1 Tax=Candidatus Kentrum sp. SD TaxID=2126332 RepID=A0A450YIH6_9GAMM|nr:MAG: hypothetical protein BECKSD772F_GA0070984_101727 [Candidatus Kentron sp. SD]VFK41309.1 MAG: hypothetical protein BECKSD772E_GA0070983_101122 [Candidatus Kentron sp. SD]